MGATDLTRLREYRPADHARVVALWTSAGIEVGPSDTYAALEGTRQRDPDLFLVAESPDDELVGVVLGRFDGRRGWVHHLAVAPDRQRQGMGRRLLEELERRLQAKGCPKLNLHVLPENTAVHGFYDRLGYTRREIVMFEKWLGAPGSEGGPAGQGGGAAPGPDPSASIIATTATFQPPSVRRQTRSAR